MHMSRVFHTWQAAGRGEWSASRERMRGRLAEIIVLDQFSRNLWRGNALSFAKMAWLWRSAKKRKGKQGLQH